MKRKLGHWVYFSTSSGRKIKFWVRDAPKGEQLVGGTDILDRIRTEGFVEGQKKVLGGLLLRECPVKYFNGTIGVAVPSEVIKKKLEELG